MLYSNGDENHEISFPNKKGV